MKAFRIIKNYSYYKKIQDYIISKGDTYISIEDLFEFWGIFSGSRGCGCLCVNSDTLEDFYNFYVLNDDYTYEE